MASKLPVAMEVSIVFIYVPPPIKAENLPRIANAGGGKVLKSRGAV
jgi:hypothetical protein